MQTVSVLLVLSFCMCTTLCLLCFIWNEREDAITPLSPQLIVKDGDYDFKVSSFDLRTKIIDLTSMKGRLIGQIHADFQDPFGSEGVGAAGTVRMTNHLNKTLASFGARPMLGQATSLVLCRWGSEMYGCMDPTHDYTAYHIRHRSGVLMLTVKGNFGDGSGRNVDVYGVNAVGVRTCWFREVDGVFRGNVAQNFDAGFMIITVYAILMHTRLVRVIWAHGPPLRDEIVWHAEPPTVEEKEEAARLRRSPPSPPTPPRQTSMLERTAAWGGWGGSPSNTPPCGGAPSRGTEAAPDAPVADRQHLGGQEDTPPTTGRLHVPPVATPQGFGLEATDAASSSNKSSPLLGPEDKVRTFSNKSSTTFKSARSSPSVVAPRAPGSSTAASIKFSSPSGPSPRATSKPKSVSPSSGKAVQVAAAKSDASAKAQAGRATRPAPRLAGKASAASPKLAVTSKASAKSGLANSPRFSTPNRLRARGEPPIPEDSEVVAEPAVLPAFVPPDDPGDAHGVDNTDYYTVFGSEGDTEHDSVMDTASE